MTRTRVLLVIATLAIQFVASCGGNGVNETPDRGKVAILTVNESEQYVEIRNDSGDSQDLRGWYLSLGRRTTCYLHEHTYLQPGETLRIWALAEDAGETGYNCGLDGPFWSGKEPKRTFLYNADDEVMDEYFAGE